MAAHSVPPGWQQRKLVALAKLYPFFERLGLHVTANHFYEPIPDLRSLSDDVFEREFELVGVDMRDDEQLDLLERVENFRAGYSAFPMHDSTNGASRYHYDNGQFGPVDADVLYAMIRIARPRRMIEIGSGFSTLVSLAAARANEAEDRTYRLQLTCVEPNPRPFLRQLPQVRLIAGKVQDQPLELFAELEAGDIFFIDSSHVLKIGSDVQYEFLEVLPRVAPGVMVHVHDVFFPKEYPPAFIKEWKLFWTEQYLVQAFLQFNDSFSVRWCSSWMALRHMERVRAAFPAFGSVSMWPSSLWLQRTRA